MDQEPQDGCYDKKRNRRLLDPLRYLTEGQIPAGWHAKVQIGMYINSGILSQPPDSSLHASVGWIMYTQHPGLVARATLETLKIMESSVGYSDHLRDRVVQDFDCRDMHWS
jgi:hypothetical protein